MNPFIAAGILEAAHRMGVLPNMSDETRYALLAGLIGYGAGTTSNNNDSVALVRSERARHLDALQRQEERMRVQAERDREERKRDYEERLRQILAHAALAHKRQ